MGNTITKHQHEVLSQIKAYIDEYGFAPTRKELAFLFNVSPQAIQQTIMDLEVAGKIKVEHNKERGIEIC